MTRTLLILIIFGIGLLIALPVLAVEFEVQYPPFGGVSPGGGPASWVRYIFFLALALTSIAAVGSLIYAGIVWMTSASSERVSEAKKQIWAAVGGVILVAGSVVILRTINPDLVSLRQPTLEGIEEGFRYQYTGASLGGACETHKECPVDQFCESTSKKCLFQYTGTSGVGKSCAGSGARACGGSLFCAATTLTCEGGAGRQNEREQCSQDQFLNIYNRCQDSFEEGQRCSVNIQGQCQKGLSCKQKDGSDPTYCLP